MNLGKVSDEERKQETTDWESNKGGLLAPSMCARTTLTLKRAGDLTSISLLSLLCLLAACMRRFIASNDCLVDLTKASMHRWLKKMNKAQ